MVLCSRSRQRAEQRARYTYNCESAGGIHLDHTVHVSKGDGQWKPCDVPRIADEVTKQFQTFGDEHPEQQAADREQVCLTGPRLRCLVAQIHDDRVGHQGWRGQRGQVKCICTPWLLAVEKSSQVSLSSYQPSSSKRIR